MTEYWFKPKRNGYGATPTSWKGWAAAFAYIVVLLSLVWAVIAARNGAVSTGVLAIWMVVVALWALLFLRFVGENRRREEVALGRARVRFAADHGRSRISGVG